MNGDCTKLGKYFKSGFFFRKKKKKFFSVHFQSLIQFSDDIV